jgi:lysylphosphatidylglycerol synthetase-like protein (DUF2156 family)
MTESAVKARTAKRGLLWVAVLAAIEVAIVNAVIFFAASGFGTITKDVKPIGNSALTVGSVAIASIIGVIAAALVFALLRRFARQPVRLFRIVATVMLICSFVSPISISGASVAMILTLMLMHIVAWAASAVLLPTFTAER